MVSHDFVDQEGRAWLRNSSILHGITDGHKAFSWWIGWSEGSKIAFLSLSSILAGMAEKLGLAETIDQRAYPQSLQPGGLNRIKQAQIRKFRFPKQSTLRNRIWKLPASQRLGPETVTVSLPLSHIGQIIRSLQDPRRQDTDSNLWPSLIPHSLYLETDTSDDTHNSLCPMFQSRN